MHDIRGSYEESYAILPDYILELQRTNPGTYTKLWWEDDDSFQRFFVAFGACVRSFKSVFRTLIALDGSHLRGKYPGSLLIAVSQDGDHGLSPIAFAAVESDCRETWSWFLANLDLALERVQNLTILSDRMKGIALAVKDVLPSAKHCYCCKHLASNIQGKFKNEGIVIKFWCAARAYHLCEYERYMAEIRDVDQGAYDYIAAIGKEHWANAFIDGRRYDMLTTNIAESTNSLFKETRELPVTQLIESIRANLMEFFQILHENSQNMRTSVTPYVDKILHKETEISRRLEARQADQNEFQVLSGEYTDIVHLDEKTCTCRQWDLIGIPCSHAVSAIKLRRYNPYDFCEHWFLTEMYRHAYNDIIHGTRDRHQWDQLSGQRILPPHARRQPGRPRKNRIRTEDRL